MAKLIKESPVELVPDWKRAWQWATVQLSALGVVFFGIIELIQAGFITLPKHLLDMVPHGSSIALVLFFITLIGRILKFKETGNEGN